MTSLTRDSVLLDRARQFLATGPAHAVPLIEFVCQVPGPPAAVAEHLAVALLAEEREFAREADGRWHVVRERVSAADPAIVGRAGSRPLASLSYCVVDVETTGTSPVTGDRVTEIAAVTVRGGEVVDVFESLVNPERSIPPFITALTHISWEMVREAPTFREIAPRVAEVLQGGVFVAHNAAFDWRFVTAEVERALGGRLEGERLCTVRLARVVLPQLRRRSLDSLSGYFGIENGARHRAAGDALATAQVLLRLLRVAEDRGCRTLEDLQRLMRPRAGSRPRRRAMPGWGDGGGELPA